MKYLDVAYLTIAPVDLYGSPVNWPNRSWLPRHTAGRTPSSPDYSPAAGVRGKTSSRSGIPAADVRTHEESQHNSSTDTDESTSYIEQLFSYLFKLANLCLHL